MDLDEKYDRLLSRRMSVEDRYTASFSEKYATRVDGLPDRVEQYLASAMAPIDEKYTSKLILQGDRVENHLRGRLVSLYPHLDFRRQGSVSNDTHIRHYSDVDVLAFEGSFEVLEMYQPNSNPYQGDPNVTLLTFRLLAHRMLKESFPAVEVDNSGSTAIKLSGGSLACSVDVVPSNWYNTLEYSQSRSEVVRGVQVLNKQTLDRTLNFPFKFNHRIELADRQRSGAVRRMIRLLKTLKADLIEDSKRSVALSSYDICSIVYRMGSEFCMRDGHGAQSEATACLAWLAMLISRPGIRDTLQVVDDSRLIFDAQERVQALAQLQIELTKVLTYNQARSIQMLG